MKIALYTGTFVENKDGVARTLYEFVSSIRRNGHEVKIWSPDITEEKSEGSMEVKKIASVPVVIYPDYKVGFFGPATKRELDDFKPDIIHISTPDLVGREFLQYGKRNNIPVVSVYHTDFPSYLSYYILGFLTPPIWGYLKWFYNQSEIALVPTIAMKERLRSKGIENVHIWSRGIKRTAFSPELRSVELRSHWKAEGKKVILYSGRFVWYKDISIFVKVYEMLTRKRNDVRFILLGSGPAEIDLKESMPDAIFPGYLTGEELGEAYASSDILLFPSTTETFGNVVQEALASGVPAVVSDTGGCAEIIRSSGAGLISRSKDPLSFLDNTERLLDDKELSRKLKNRGLSFSKKRSWNYINDGILELYQSIINGD